MESKEGAEMPINKIEGKKKNGLQGYRVRVNYTDMNGNPRQVERTAWGLAEAQMLEQKLLVEFKEKKQTSKSKMTIQGLYNEYMEYHATETRKTSHASTAAKLTKACVAVFRDLSA